MADIFEEVDEEVRRDEQLKLWQRYGKFVIAGMIVVVGITAAIVGWREYQKRISLEESARFEAATKLATEKKAKEAADAYGAVDREARTGYRDLALMREAALKLNAGDAKTAAGLYDQVASGGGDPALRDLATVLFVTASLETGKPDELRVRLQPLLAKDHTWRHSARELAALISLRTGDAKGAREMLTLIKDDRAAPPSLRRRANELLAVMK